ncbi:MAG: aminotransferase class IV [Desulfobacterales bacterium]|nr:aminotransferase class IV [Desulfobacterales bacterium]MCP4162721.1 aminotransferase class IV [Deltaproteobacteria bacterium]
MKNEAIFKYYFKNNKLTPTSDNDIFNSLENDSVYEVIKVVNGVALFLEEHMNRMRFSAKNMIIPFECSDKSIKEKINELVKKNNKRNNNVKVICSREKTFLTYMVKSNYPKKENYEEGVHTILFKGERENPNFKTLKDAFKSRVSKLTKKENAREALLVNKDNFITEGARSNIFFVLGQSIYTPPANKVLQGITRKYILKICKNKGFDVQEKLLHTDDIKKIKGAFLTGTSIGFLPISSIGDFQLNSIKEPYVKEIIKCFDQTMDKYISDSL